MTQTPAADIVERLRARRTPGRVDFGTKAYSVISEPDQLCAEAATEIEALRAREAELVAPWADYRGDLPDYDHPLRCVFESGVQYAVELLAKTLNVDDYQICDGTEEFDGDLSGTMFNIVLEALPKDKDGDPYHPRELVEKVSELQRKLDEAVKALEGLCTSVNDLIDHSDGVAGLHLNGDLAAWSSLTKGGQFEPWLRALADAEDALASIRGEG